MSPIKDLILSTLAMLVWASTGEIAAHVERHRTTVLRHLQDLMADGLVGFRLAGRPPTALRRWLLWQEGVYRLFPDRHRHPGPGDRHRHDPTAESILDHLHPSYWNSQKGAAELWGYRLQLLQFLYPLAINLCKGECARFHPEKLEAKLLRFRWLQHGRLVIAVGEYEGGVNVFFEWVPLGLTDSALKGRWERRTSGLLVRSEDNDKPHDWYSPPDPECDGTPRPSLNVVIGEDPGAAVVARRVLVDGIRRGKMAWPLLRVCLTDPGMRLMEGTLLPVSDNMWDPPRDQHIGNPEKLCEPVNEDEEFEEEAD